MTSTAISEPLAVPYPDQADPDRSDVLRAIAGDDEAFRSVYGRHYGKIARLANYLLASDDVADVVQEIFMQAWRKMKSWRGSGPFAAWLRRLAVREILARRASLGRHASRELDISLAATVEAPGERSLDVQIDLQNAVARLPQRAREVFVLHDIEALTHDEIAALTGIQPQTSRSQLCRARLLLRQFLEEEENA